MSSEILRPTRVPKVTQARKGKRTLHRVTLSKKSIAPGDTFYATLPKLRENMTFVPYSTFLKFKLVLKNEEDYVVPNFCKNLVVQYKVFLGTEEIKCTHRNDLFEGFRDMVEVEEDLPLGNQSALFSKTRHKKTGKSTNAKELALCNTYGNHYWIPLTHPILDEHGAFCQRGMFDDSRFELEFAREGAVVIAADKTKSYAFTLDELRLEYTTIENTALFNEAKALLDTGKTFLIEDVHLFETIQGIDLETQKQLFLQILELRGCMKGVFLLFVKDFTNGARNTLEFINPLVDSVQVTINGVPNQLFSSAMQRYDLWRVFKHKFAVGDHFKEQDFHSDKFGLWVDLRAAVDESLHGDGIKNGQEGSGVRIEIKWKGKAGTTVTCFVYVISDAGVFVKGGRLKEFRLKRTKEDEERKK